MEKRMLSADEITGDVYPVIAKRVKENMDWKNKTFDLFEHYKSSGEEETLGDILITMCADIEETALRIQYAVCKDDFRDIRALLWSFRLKAFSIMVVEDKFLEKMKIAEQEG